MSKKLQCKFYPIFGSSEFVKNLSQDKGKFYFWISCSFCDQKLKNSELGFGAASIIIIIIIPSPFCKLGHLKGFTYFSEGSVLNLKL